MERLTIRNSDGSVSQPMTLKWAEALERLAAYEDLEEQGRLVVLPARTVFCIEWVAGKNCDGICPVTIDDIPCCNFCDHGEQSVCECRCTQELAAQIGKTVFFSREEAEAALRKE